MQNATNHNPITQLKFLLVVNEKRYTKIFENSFLKNGILDFLAKALIFSISIVESYKKYVLQQNSNDERCLESTEKLANFVLLSLYHLIYRIPTA